MFDEPFRARFAAVSLPAARWLCRLGVTPNHLTLAAGGLALVAAALVASGYARTGLALWFVSRIADGLDGAVARAAGSSSAFGGFLDITLDMAAYSAMVVGFAVAHPAHVLASLCVLAGYVLVITTTLALSDAANVAQRRVSATNRTFQFTRGFAEAGETNVTYTLWVLFPGYLAALTWAWAAVLLITSAQRVYQAWRVLR